MFCVIDIMNKIYTLNLHLRLNLGQKKKIKFGPITGIFRVSSPNLEIEVCSIFSSRYSFSSFTSQDRLLYRVSPTVLYQQYPGYHCTVLYQLTSLVIIELYCTDYTPWLSLNCTVPIIHPGYHWTVLYRLYTLVIIELYCTHYTPWL